MCVFCQLQYNSAQQSKADYYSEEPIKVKETISALPELPNLPEDDNVSTPEVSDDGNKVANHFFFACSLFWDFVLPQLFTMHDDL